MLKVFVIILFVVITALWIAAGISDANKMSSQKQSKKNKIKKTSWKIIIGIFIWFEKQIWWYTGLKLPMYRRRLILRASHLQKQLNLVHDTAISYPEPKKRPIFNFR